MEKNHVCITFSGYCRALVALHLLRLLYWKPSTIILFHSPTGCRQMALQLRIIGINQSWTRTLAASRACSSSECFSLCEPLLTGMYLYYSQLVGVMYHISISSNSDVSDVFCCFLTFSAPFRCNVCTKSNSDVSDVFRCFLCFPHFSIYFHLYSVLSFSFPYYDPTVLILNFPLIRLLSC